MKCIALTYDYDLKKLSEIGRTWAFDVYKNKDHIFEYSSACYASFIDKNPKLELNLFTDDVELMRSKLSKYKIDLNRIIFHDYRERLSKYIDLDYSFRIVFDFIKENTSKDDYTIKIDNDMIFLDALPIMDNKSKEVMVWKYERIVANGNPLWGEIKACQIGLNEIYFPIYNMGLLGLPVGFNLESTEIAMNKLINVDISDVTDLDTKIYHCVEQTAWNYEFFKIGYHIRETHRFIRHHFDNKNKCIEDAKYLLK